MYTAPLYDSSGAVFVGEKPGFCATFACLEPGFFLCIHYRTLFFRTQITQMNTDLPLFLCFRRPTYLLRDALQARFQARDGKISKRKSAPKSVVSVKSVSKYVLVQKVSGSEPLIRTSNVQFTDPVVLVTPVRVLPRARSATRCRKLARHSRRTLLHASDILPP